MKYTKIVDEDIYDIIKSVDFKNISKKIINKTILITGASGMIGSYLSFVFIKLNELYDYNIKLLLLVRKKEKLSQYILNNKNIIVIEQDVCDKIDYDENVDYIIHAASPASPKIMRDYPVETNFANTLGTANTLKFANEKKALGYLFISSREIYGEPNVDQEYFYEDGPLGQVNPLIPRNGYAEGKKSAENMCVSFREQYGLNTKIVRLAHTYGPGMSIYDGRVQADFLNDIINKRDIVLKSDGSSIRTYTYIADAIKGILLVLFYGKEIVYNIGDEKNITSIKDLALTLISLNSEDNLKIVFDIPNVVDKGTASFKKGILSSKRIREELKWNPQYSIKDGFERTIIHIKEEME